MNFFRQNIQDMSPYVPGLQLNDPDIIKLNTNENPFPPSNTVLNAVREGVNTSLRLYPNPTSDTLRDTLASTYSLKREQIIVGNGSDEVLAMIMRACVAPGDNVLLFYPTYSLYDVLAYANDATITEIELDESFNIPDKAFGVKARLCYLPNPNVPAGNYIDKQTIIRLAESIGGLLVIDEAYVDFAEQSCIDLVEKYNNIVVTRTFSKSFSLAGMRIGYAVAKPSVIAGVMKVKDSYNLDRISEIAATASIRDLAEIKKRCSYIKHVRDNTAQRLRSMNFHVLPSQTNFLFVKPPGVDAEYLYEALLNRKILVRFFNQRRVKEYLRITIGMQEDMDILISTLKELL
ncbi:MAG: histidinol-phosphate transaminase [Candidatus Auribacterota bacterium]